MASKSVVRELSYGDIVRRVETATGALLRAGAAPGQRIGIHCGDRLLQIVLVIGLSRIPDATLAFSRDGLFAPGSIDLLVTDDPARKEQVKIILIDGSALAAAAVHSASPVALPAGGHTTWMFSNAAVLGGVLFDARIAQRALAKGTGAGSRWLCAACIHSEIGLSAVIECLLHGGLAVLSSGALEDDVSSIALYEADHLFVDADQAATYLRVSDTTSQISTPLRAAVMSGPAPDEAAARQMKRHLSPDTAIYLDLPETGAIAACSDWQSGKPRRYWPLPGVELRGVDGAIAIRSARTVSPQSADADGWFRSALLGTIAADGALVLAEGAAS